MTERQIIKVIVHGALGRMGREITESLSKEPDMQVVGGVDKAATSDSFVLQGGTRIPMRTTMAQLLTERTADVVVDFSVAEATMQAARSAIPAGARMVIGTTGLTPTDIAEIESLCQKHRGAAVVASNFTIGAVLLIHLAKMASRFFDYAEIIELHHEKKLDAPSGTALTTAQAMVAARDEPFLYQKASKETLKGTRGGETGGVAVHSVRLPGLLAHQEVVFGGPGQTLTIRHDTISRECYMPGITTAVREVVKLKGVVNGLDKLLGLG
ncbi:MAG: 4-hydroxy-tetrahydrodipicolinate reductase [Chloroflexi bacterium]|nr:4-hydroxy-tetrahydrodipicolinate reductase [Chloroflexota bacterium]